MTAHPARLADWLQLIRAEFEAPSGLRVTPAEACARWPLGHTRLIGILDVLVFARYLVRTVDGVYYRRPDICTGDDLPPMPSRQDAPSAGVVPRH